MCVRYCKFCDRSDTDSDTCHLKNIHLNNQQQFKKLTITNPSQHWYMGPIWVIPGQHGFHVGMGWKWAIYVCPMCFSQCGSHIGLHIWDLHGIYVGMGWKWAIYVGPMCASQCGSHIGLNIWDHRGIYVGKMISHLKYIFTPLNFWLIVTF